MNFLQGQQNMETSLTYAEHQTYGATDAQPVSQFPAPVGNPFNNSQWGDEAPGVSPSQLDLSQMAPGRVVNPFTHGTISEEPVQPRNTDYAQYRQY